MLSTSEEKQENIPITSTESMMEAFELVEDAGKKEEQKDVELEGDRSGLHLSTRSKRLRTLLIYSTNLFHGMQNNLLGPSLVDLEYLTGSTTSGISTVFSWRNGGYLLGALLGGPLVDRFNEHLVMSGVLLIMAIAISVAPFWRHLLGLGLTFAGIGFSACLQTVGATTTIILIWASRADPFQMALMFVVNSGAALTPQLFKPFLRASNSLNSTNWTQYVNDSHQSALNLQALPQTQSQIHIGYLVVSSGVLLMAVFHFCVFIHDGKNVRRSVKKHIKGGEILFNIENKAKFIALTMFFALSFIQGGLEELFGGFLMTFTVKYLSWSTDKASDLATVFWVANSCSRGIGIIASKFLKPPTILFFDVMVLILSSCFFAVGLRLSWVVPWFCTALAGVGCGTLMASIINWCNSCMVLRGKETSVILAGGSISRMITLAIVGYLFQSVSPMWFLYVYVMYSLASLTILIITWAFVKCTLKQLTSRETNVKCLEMVDPQELISNC